MRKNRQTRLSRYRPYPKQWEFHCALFKERLNIAGNQIGKTHACSFEAAMHATGLYPKWWEGKRFDKPTIGWCGSETNTTSRDIVQLALLGNPEGTGSIPGEWIKKTSPRQAGIPNVVDQIQVRHVSGGTSHISLKTYEQGRKIWIGTPVDWIWDDEESPEDIYLEAVTRTQATKGLVMTSFTPMLGYSSVVNRFLRPEEDDPPRHVTTMTLHDCIGGIWPEGTPWAGEEWTGHYTAEEVEQIIANMSEHERNTRALGVPMMGEGLIYPIAESDIRFTPFAMPDHFARINAVDFGIDHPAAVVCISHDRHLDIVYVIDAFKKANETITYHAQAIKSRGAWIPVAWPHDGLNREKSSGRKLKDMYKEHGCAMLKDSARYHKDKGGGQDTGPVIMDILERMKTGRFKVAAHLEAWFEEFRTYHRKDNQIQKVGDDIMAATNYGMMELRHARTKVELMPVRRAPRYVQPIVGAPV